jgi:hypothetical protein
MRRRRGGNTETAEAPLEAPTTEPSEEPRISVRMEGTADQVKKQLGVAPETKPEEKKPDEVEDAEKFFALLKNPKLIIKVKRLRPKQWRGTRTAVEVWSSELPLQWEEIKQEISETANGGTYKVSVVNPETGGIIDARNFEVDGDPKLPDGTLTPEEQAIFDVGKEPEKDAATVTEEGLERSARITAKQIEYERLQQSLKELRGGGTNGNNKNRSSESDARIDDLERRLVQAKHEADLENQQRKHEVEMKELRDLVKQQSQQKPAQQQSDVAIILQQMREDRTASDRRFEAMQKQMHDDKQNQMLEELRALRNKPAQQGNTMLENLEAMLKMKKLMGWGGSDEDDEDEDEKDDDRPWWERALDQLGKRLTPKLLDKIFDRLDGLENGGKKVDRETFLKTIEEEKKKEDELVRIATEEAIKRLPAPKEVTSSTVTSSGANKPAGDVPVVNVMERKIVSGEALPPLPVPKEVPTTPATVPQAEQKPDPKAAPDELAKIVCQRVAELVVFVDQEMQLRPRQYDWNYDVAWKALPEAILEKVCQAKTPAEFFDACKVEGLDLELLEKFKQKTLADAKASAWLQKGITELNRWWAKSLKNPNFDPADEDESEPEEEGTGL